MPSPRRPGDPPSPGRSRGTAPRSFVRVVRVALSLVPVQNSARGGMSGAVGGGATVEELKDALRETLENRGALGNVRAHLRAEVSNALEDRAGSARPEISDENLIINELIREYLVFNRYRSTLSVLLPESGQPEVPPFDREFLAREIRAKENEDSRKLPLLYTMLANAQRERR